MKWDYHRLGDEFDKLVESYLNNPGKAGPDNLAKWEAYRAKWEALLKEAGWTENEFDEELERRIIEKHMPRPI